MFNMLKVCRELFGSWVTAAPSKRSSNLKRKPHRTLLRLEELERRLVPAPFLTTWTDADHNNLASDANNWTNGKPDATTQAIFDGSKTSDSISFDQQVTCDGILVKNSYTGQMVNLAAVASNATVEIQQYSILTLITSVGNGNNPLQLTNGAALRVDSGGSLNLDDNNNTNASTFLTGDGMAGEILNNSGSITYRGYTGNFDHLNIPVLNNGSFALEGKYYGTNLPGSELEVKGSDPLTSNVSWYQNATGASTSLSGNVTLQADASYTQNAGTLVIGAGKTSNYGYLYGGSPANLLTININGGTVRFQSGALTYYGGLYIYAANVNVAGELDVRINGQVPPSSDIIIVGNASGKMTFQPGAKLVVNPGGAVKAKSNWGAVLTANGGFVNPDNLTINANGTVVTPGAATYTVTSN